jgi:multiple antibiotic resistance protein
LDLSVLFDAARYAAGSLLAVFIPVFIAMDPIGTMPLVVAWTSHLAPSERTRQLRLGLLTALVVGFAFLIWGSGLLAMLGVTVSDFLIAGGIVLLVLAVTDLMVGGGHETLGSVPRPDLGVVPIGTPLLAGPATLTTLIVLTEQYGHVLTGVALLANLLIAWRLFAAAGAVTRFFGQNGLRATSKLVSLLLAALAVKFIREGVFAILAL